MDDTTGYGIEAPGYRLPAGTHIGVVRLQVADLDRSIEYYGRVHGLDVADRSAEHAVLGATDGLPLIELREKPGAAPVPSGGRLGLYHYAILLPDRAALGAFIRHLSGIGERFGASDHLVSEALYLSDPDGLGIEVYADRPRGEWRHESGQLVMATEPLDVAALADAAPERDWNGMPAGTTIGHVHLHVDDLEAATAFYHGAVGLDKVVWSYPGALFLSAGGYHHHLGVNTWARGAAPGESDAKLLEWELRVPALDDLEAVGTSLDRAGYGAERQRNELLTRDPSGTALRVRADEAL